MAPITSPVGSERTPPSFKLRPAGRTDAAFLFQLYASTRVEELAPLGWSTEQRDVFLRQQFAARTQSYAAAFPRAEQTILQVRGTSAGAFILHRTREELRVVDIALLPQFRGQGIGERLLRGLQEEATAKHCPLRLQVLKSNPATRLYARLGFAPAGDNGLYLKMEWLPPVAR